MGTSNHVLVADARLRPLSLVTRYRLLLTIAVRVELADVSPQVFLLLLVLNAREDHFCAWHFSRRILM